MSKSVLNVLLIVVLAAIALAGCGSEPAEQEVAGTLDMPLATEENGLTHRVVGTILIRRHGNGQVAATIEAGPTSPNSESVKLPPGSYTVEVVDGYRCTVAPEDVILSGCTYTGANPQAFVITPGRISTVVLTFVFHFNEDVPVALRTGSATIILDPVADRPCGADGCPSGERCVSIDDAAPACAGECAADADCGSDEACFALDDDSGSVCASIVTTLWTHQVGVEGIDRTYSVATDGDGNVLITGITQATLPDQTSSGGPDAFVRKLDPDGNVLWTRQFGTDNLDLAFAIATDSAGNALVAGYTYGTFPGQTNAGGSDAFLQKLDPDGNLLWAHQVGSSSNDEASAVALDGDGNVLVSGFTPGALSGQTNLGGNDAFVQKLDADGNVLWTRQFGSSSDDTARGVAVDSEENVLLAGGTVGTLPGQTSLGFNDAYVQKFDANGNVLWTRQLGSDRVDYATAVAVDNVGHVLFTGLTQGTLPGQTSQGGTGDAFVQKLDADGNALWTSQFGSSASDEAFSVATDSARNVLLAGGTRGAFPGQTHLGNADMFVRKLDADGNALWTTQSGTELYDVALDVTTDGAGNALVGGITVGALSGQTNAGSEDAFVLKLEP